LVDHPGFKTYQTLLWERAQQANERLLLGDFKTTGELHEAKSRVATYIEVIEFVDILINTVEAERARTERRNAVVERTGADARFFGSPTFLGRKNRWGDA